MLFGQKNFASTKICTPVHLRLSQRSRRVIDGLEHESNLKIPVANSKSDNRFSTSHKITDEK